MMGLIEITVLALALAADAFSVAVGVGIALTSAHGNASGRLSGRPLFRLSWHFGLFQFLMPIVGWAAGRTVVTSLAWIEQADHWIALGLLTYVGGKMIWEARKPEADRDRTQDPTRGLSLVILSLATSMDALAVGLSMAMLRVAILLPCVIIGLVAGGMTILGMTLGRRLGRLFSSRIETVGGLVLILIGIRIVLDHLGIW